jgi:acylphosphatase
MSHDAAALHVLVSGRVQGVGFRMWSARQAEAVGLGGWVRNRRDGTVEALLCGSADTVDAWLAQIRTGPPMARVDTVATRAATADEIALCSEGHGAFVVLPTA